jgi:uncharacterized protein (DUF983 family)
MSRINAPVQAGETRVVTRLTPGLVPKRCKACGGEFLYEATIPRPRCKMCGKRKVYDFQHGSKK